MWEWIKKLFKKPKVENMEIRKLEYLISQWLSSKTGPGEWRKIL